MIKYENIRPRVYVESTVISYLVARPSKNPILANRQNISQQVWDNYTDKYEFVISSIVRDEIQKGDETASNKRLDIITSLKVLEILPETNNLVQKLLDTETIPRNSEPDDQHIAIATVHNVDYLVSWNYKHIVNENKREEINNVCRNVGFKPVKICTPIELIEEFQMKESPEKQADFDPETYTDPILEECYRIKAEISAQFETLEDFFSYLKAKEEEEKRNGVKYVSYYDPEKHKAALKALEDV